MSTDNTADEVTCEYCGERFGDEGERAMHWSRDHAPGDGLTDEDRQAAIDEGNRRREANEFAVKVAVEIPRDTWEFIVAREHGPDADPTRYSPEQFPEAVRELMTLEFDWRVEGRAD